MGHLDTPATSADGRAPSQGAVCLLDAEPAFAVPIPFEDVALARRVLTVPRVDVPNGSWASPPRDSWHEPVTALVVVRGALARHIAVGGRTTTHFVGPGDLVQPWAHHSEALPCRTTWTAVEPTSLAVLDRRFSMAATRWPGLSMVLVDRLAGEVHRAAAHTAISHLPRVEQRILATLWQLAERFGRVGPDGTDIDLRLTHAVIGDCVGARRPTVTLALRTLLDAELVQRSARGAWTVTRPSLRALHDMLGDAAPEGQVPLRVLA
jgi:CRP-like cAMP-binding protein